MRINNYGGCSVVLCKENNSGYGYQMHFLLSCQMISRLCGRNSGPRGSPHYKSILYSLHRGCHILYHTGCGRLLPNIRSLMLLE